MQNPAQPSKMIDLMAIRSRADRQREDTDTIATLCDGIDTLLNENQALKAKLAEFEKAAPEKK
jgi:hypothetical protein